MKLFDKYNRQHDYLRLSVTDRCNLNCSYCNPHKSSDNFKNHNTLLSFEEIVRIVEIFVNRFEFKKIRLTGGEPFARKDIVSLIRSLNELKIVTPFELLATSNGILIEDKIEELFQSGIDRFNFSLDTLHQDKFIDITGFNRFNQSMKSIQSAINIGNKKLKLNTVIMRGINDDELIDFVDFAVNNDITIRFIEYMPFANNGYDKSKFISYKEMIEIISEKYILQKSNEEIGSVSKNFTVEKHSGRISFITSISDHFCDSCNRLRLTSDGKLKLCLFSLNDQDLDLRSLLRNGKSDNEIEDTIIGFISNKLEMHDELDKLINFKHNSMISIGG